MAVVLLKGNIVTNADGTTPPQVLNQARAAAARLKESVDTIEITNGDSIASIYRMARVHSSWRISQIVKYSDAITSAAADVGLYDIAANGGAVVDVDFFGSAVSLASLDLVGTDVTHEAGGTGVQFGEIANIRKALWEVLGLTQDPNKYYDLAFTLTAAATASGTLSVAVRYSDGN
jgi:hypothetical protein